MLERLYIPEAAAQEEVTMNSHLQSGGSVQTMGQELCGLAGADQAAGHSEPLVTIPCGAAISPQAKPHP